MSNDDTSVAHVRSTWETLLVVNSIILSCIVVAVVGLAYLFYRHDENARDTQPVITPTLRALELENAELRDEVGYLKVELHKKQVRLATQATSRAQSCTTDKPARADDDKSATTEPSPSKVYANPLVNKMHIRRLGQP